MCFSQISVMSVWVLFCIFTFYAFKCVSSEVVIEGTVSVNGKSRIGRIDDDFVCATLDWWPPEKCDYGTCAWGRASLLNLDLNNHIFFNAIKAFSPLKIRLGGFLQDKVIYGTKDNKQPCVPFVSKKREVSGFTQGCLPMSRWDELNVFFKKSGAKIIFGLNALTGRTLKPDGAALGPWNYTNAESFIRYTVEKKYTISGWELGNELSGSGLGYHISADQYAKDTIVLRNIVKDIYKNIHPKPQVIAPGGTYDEGWFKEFINKTSTSLEVLTHHIYNLGPGAEADTRLVEKILTPQDLDAVADTFKEIQNILKTSSSSAASWVGEAGGAYSSGHHLVTDAFVFSFWYLDQLGMSATFDTKTYCRQTLIGGNYGLLNTTTFVPNPDYYSALLWHRLMGRNVLPTRFSGTNKIRSYAHCAKKSKGVTLLLINLDSNTTVKAKVEFTNSWKSLKHKHNSSNDSIESRREEYHLTAKGHDLQSQTMLLNGNVLSVSSNGEIPSLKPVYVNSSRPIMVAPFSIVFVHIPNVAVRACNN